MILTNFLSTTLTKHSVAFNTKTRGQGGAVVNAAAARALLQHVEVTSDADADDDGASRITTAAAAAAAAAETRSDQASALDASIVGAALITPCPDAAAGGAPPSTRCFDAVRDALGTTEGRIEVAAAVGMARDEGFEAVIIVDSPEDGPAVGVCRSLDVGDATTSHGPAADAAAVAAFLSSSSSAAAAKVSRACNLRAAVAEAGRSGAPTLVYVTPAAVHTVTEGAMIVPADAFIKVGRGVVDEWERRDRP